MTPANIKEKRKYHLTLPTSEHKQALKTLLHGEICREIELRGTLLVRLGGSITRQTRIFHKNVGKNERIKLVEMENRERKRNESRTTGIRRMIKMEEENGTEANKVGKKVNGENGRNFIGTAKQKSDIYSIT